MELLGASQNPKTPVNTIYLDASIRRIAGFDADEEARDRKNYPARYHQVGAYLLRSQSSRRRTRQSRKIAIFYSCTKNSSKTNGQPGGTSSGRAFEFDNMEMVSRNVIDMTMIAAKIQNNRVLKVFECVHSDTNAPGKLVKDAYLLPAMLSRTSWLCDSLKKSFWILSA